MPKTITLILGHPDANSLCGALAERYADTARARGHTVHTFHLGEIAFDPILRHGYREAQPLEPGLEAIRDAITASSHLVFIYPIWWGGMPALLKGMFDRLFLSGFAYRMRPNSPWWDKLLTGRSADLLVTLDTPPWYYRLIYGSPGHKQMMRTILGYCGVKPIRLTSFSPVRSSSAEQRAGWLDQAAALATRLG